MEKNVKSGVSDRVALAGEMSEAGHKLIARVYYADTDFSGVVYHARYLEFLERGRSDFLRLMGVHHNELARGNLEGNDLENKQSGTNGEQIAWIVRHMDISFKSSAHIDDVLEIITSTKKISGARIYMSQLIKRGSDVLIEASVEAAIIGENGKPRRFPKAWVEAFSGPFI